MMPSLLIGKKMSRESASQGIRGRRSSGSALAGV